MVGKLKHHAQAEKKEKLLKIQDRDGTDMEFYLTTEPINYQPCRYG
jgi:hypothetical protein